MLIYLLRRIVLGVSVVTAAIVATFAIFFLGPSDPAGALCGRNCTPDRIATIEKSLGLDKPKVEQLVDYVGGVVVGRDMRAGGLVNHCDAPCLGWSYVQNRPVTDMVMQAFPVTASIVVGGVVVYTILGIGLGILCARFRGQWLDKVIVTISQVLGAIPYYVLAVVFFLYAMKFYGVIPQSSWTPLTQNPWAWFTGLLGVWLFYGTIASASYVRYVRASMIDVQGQDYVRTARSKGISERRIAVKHALRAAIAPFLTLLGLSIAAELTGAIYTETVFGLPGMGLLSINSFNNSDLPVISGVVVVSAALIVVANIIVDVLYGVVDPRVKLS
ncbi:ABC transporter permease [Rudaeicoccus suwonensis]|uniref:Peptide/nickel transport system permease protein n=1 Tax=Rudaeicoccus suwonensis TaxID=657409 RepID=A0A561EA61_9MICO|nr:ABC transporter permease [Rudaeicoccus suwonensis]TWE12505.1 peptide/nickel transport system permease protein [Rudaeicoccus suwonensis]